MAGATDEGPRVHALSGHDETGDAVGFVAAARRSLPRWLSAGALAAVGSYWLASVWDAQRQVHAALWLGVGFVLLPVAFTLALAAVAALLTALLALLATPAALAGRRTGLAGVLGDLWRLPRHVVPGFWRALRRVRRPGLWGGLLGFAVGTALFAAQNGLNS